MTELLTIEQVAERLQVSKRTVRRAIDERGLRAVQVAGRGTWRVRAPDLEDWLEQRTSTQRPLAPIAPASAVVALTTRRPRRPGNGRLAVTDEMGRTA